MVYERVLIDGDEYHVKHEDNERGRTHRKSCVAYLSDCGHVITTEHVSPQSVDKWLTWPVLSDTIEPRDR